MLLLPIALGLAILALLVILRGERRNRTAGREAPRPLYVQMVLWFFALIVLAYVSVNLLSALTA